MKKSQRLQRIANLSHTAEQIAAQAFNRARDEVERYATQVRDLERYRDEYLRQVGGDTGVVNGYQVQKLRAFVGRIEEALAQLRARQEQAERRREQQRAVWMERRRRSNTLGEVASRAREHEQVELEKRLQREIDDRPRVPQGEQGG
jgi:flagellar FliJ protein